MKGVYLPALLIVAAAVAARGQVQTLPLASPAEKQDGNFGYAIAGVLDATGDSHGEVVVGAWWEDGGTTQAGKAYLFNGATGALLRTLLSPSPQPQGFFGAAVGGINDLDGDGRGDIAIGADYEDAQVPGDDAGRAHIFSGATGAFIRTLVSPNYIADGHFGISVAGVTDVNADGRGEVLVGAYKENPGGNFQAGRAYLFNGSSGGLLRTFQSPTFDFSGFYGFAVAGVPDLTGDGRGDILIGAYREFVGAHGDAGRAHLYNGSTGILIRTIVPASPADFGYFGFALSGVPDLNADGRGDYAIGEPGGGKIHVYDGNSGALIRSLQSPNDPAALGPSVAGVPDFDADGKGDIVAGAQFESGGAIFSGRAYVFSGGTGAVISTLTSPNAVLNGGFGYSVAGIPDVVSDGAGDVAIGAPFEHPGASPNGAGRAYIFFQVNSAAGWTAYE